MCPVMTAGAPARMLQGTIDRMPRMRLVLLKPDLGSGAFILLPNVGQLLPPHRTLLHTAVAQSDVPVDRAAEGGLVQHIRFLCVRSQEFITQVARWVEVGPIRSRCFRAV